MAATSIPESDPSRQGSSAAPLFWICLLVAAGLYAPCVLAGRFVAWWDLQQRYLRNQAQLIAVQQQIQHLQRVSDALEHDPDFAGQVARAELGAVPSGTQVIALPAELNSDPRVLLARPEVEAPVEAWYMPVLRRISTDAALRRYLLSAAAGVFLLGFLCFRETARSGMPPGASAPSRGVWRTILGRYLTPHRRP
jgi:hypothetical protein